MANLPFGLTGFVILVGLLIVLRSLRVLPQYQRGVVLTVGRFSGVRGPGVTLVLPLIQTMLRADMRVAVMDVPPQDVISKDNVAVKVAAVVYYRVSDPAKALLEVENYRNAIGQLALITTRSTLGAHTLDELLGEQESLKRAIRELLDQRTEAWGVEVQNVEIRSVDLDPNMIRAMGQEAEAERGRRARVITALGEFEAAGKLAEAAKVMADSQGAMLLRYLSTLKDIAVEHNSTIIFPVPSDFMASAGMGIQPILDRLLKDRGASPEASVQ